MQPYVHISGRDSTLLAFLIVTLFGATYPFFGLFTAMTVAAGVGTAIWLRSWHNRHPAVLARRNGNGRRPEINISAIHVGGDVGGLLFAAGCVAIVLIGMPGIRVFLVASLLLAFALAAAIIGWRKAHWSEQRTSNLKLRT